MNRLTVMCLALIITATASLTPVTPAAATPAAAPTATQAAPTLADIIVWATAHHPFFICVRRHESDRGGAPLHLGGFTAENPVSSASGAYQFLDSTWQRGWINSARQSPPTARASQASPYMQSLLAGIIFIHGGARNWAGSGCGYGT